ncbi:hypothetical protein HKX48_008421 [Thoreauomyces humboldtii]|nr:hypothetical protein HKX48_008421 [Thoreauomyces humboldtii]
MASQALYPPFRYGMIEDDLYRGAYPKDRNFAFLSRLGLRTILSLTPDPANPALAAFCSANKINPVHVRVDKPKEHIPLSFNKTAQILGILIDPANHPLYFHCLDGAEVSTAVSMCLRRLQCWTMAPILAESTRYHKESIIGTEEAEFAEKFNAEIEITTKLPRWLWGGHMTFKKHPSLRVKIPAPLALGSVGKMSTPVVGGSDNMAGTTMTPAEGSGGNNSFSGPAGVASSEVSDAVDGDNLHPPQSSNSKLSRRSFDVSGVASNASTPTTPSSATVALQHRRPSSKDNPDASASNSNSSSRSDMRREKEDLRRRAVTDNNNPPLRDSGEVQATSGRPSEQGRGMQDGDDDDGQGDPMSMTLRALDLEMSTPFSKSK